MSAPTAPTLLSGLVAAVTRRIEPATVSEPGRVAREEPPRPVQASTERETSTNETTTPSPRRERAATAYDKSDESQTRRDLPEPPRADRASVEEPSRDQSSPSSPGVGARSDADAGPGVVLPSPRQVQDDAGPAPVVDRSPEERVWDDTTSGHTPGTAHHRPTTHSGLAAPSDSGDRRNANPALDDEPEKHAEPEDSGYRAREIMIRDPSQAEPDNFSPPSTEAGISPLDTPEQPLEPLLAGPDRQRRMPDLHIGLIEVVVMPPDTPARRPSPQDTSISNLSGRHHLRRF